MSSERRLYVGAPLNLAGWEVYLDTPHPDADHVGPLDELRGIEKDSVSILYVQALARLTFQAQALAAMRAWHQALRPGGAFLCVGVDATAVGATLAASPSFDDQATLTRILSEQKSHWTAELLSTCLQIAGFTNVRRAETLSLFNDVSVLQLSGRRLSLNILADK